MKKHLISLFIIFLALPVVTHANTFYYNITQEQTVQEIQTDLQALIYSAIDNDTVIVTGSKTDANTTLMLRIYEGTTVVWNAHYQSGISAVANALIAFEDKGTLEIRGTLISTNMPAIVATDTKSTIVVSGTGKVQSFGNTMRAISTYGDVEIKDNAQVSGTVEEIIATHGPSSVITMSGGEVSAIDGNAFVAYGSLAKISISGGYVSNNATDLYPTVVAPTGSGGVSIYVSGTGKVEAKGHGSAIISTGSVWLSENAQVSTTLGGGNMETAAIKADWNVVVGGNAKVSALNNYAIWGYQYIRISNNGIVEAKGDAIAIYIDIAGGGMNKLVAMEDKAQVIAAHNYAISHQPMADFILRFKGGMMFGYGNAISDVINHSSFTAPTDSGVVIVWNKEAGHTNYEMFSTDDILKFPESATAYWDKKGGQSGISYAKSQNTGFIPLDVTVLSVQESCLPNLKLYPNPTTGELKIENGEWRIENVEVFDVYGRNVGANLRVCPHTAIDMLELPTGVYFVKITTNAGETIKKVVKR